MNVNKSDNSLDDDQFETILLTKTPELTHRDSVKLEPANLNLTPPYQPLYPRGEK